MKKLLLALLFITVVQLFTVDVFISPINVNENEGVAAVVVNLSETTNIDISVDYNIADGTAIYMQDYDGSITGTITIFSGQTTAQININIIDDTIFEPEEMFTVNIANPTAGTIAQSSANVTITDDDVAIDLNMTGFTVNESGGTGQVVFTISQSFGMDITIGFEILPGSATDTADYYYSGGSTGSVIIQSGMTTASIDIDIMNDAISEPIETFNINITNVSDPAINIMISTATCTINDDDLSLEITIADMSVLESDGSIGIPVYLSVSNSNIVSIDFQITPNTASNPEDFTASALNGSISIIQGDTVGYINVDIVNDSLVEGTESFDISLIGSTEGTIVQSNCIITLIDDDDATSTTVNVLGSSLMENSGDLDIIFQLSSTLISDVIVDYQIINGSAELGIDFSVAQTGQVTIISGHSTASLLISLNDDLLVEGDENFYIQINNVSGGLSIGSTTVECIIYDDESIPTSFTDDGYHFAPFNTIVDLNKNPSIQMPVLVELDDKEISFKVVGKTGTMIYSEKIFIPTENNGNILVDWKNIPNDIWAGKYYILMECRKLNGEIKWSERQVLILTR